MSTHDPIDQSIIKQAVLVDFLKFYLKKNEIWAVLNEESVLFASDVFLLTGIEHFLYKTFRSSFIALLKDNFIDIPSKCIVISFPSFSQYSQLKSPPIYWIEVSKFNEQLFYIKAISLFSNSLSLYDINIVKKSESIKKIPLDRFKYVNPSEVLLDDEWKVAWLFISGMSYRQIASILNVSRTTVENKMKSSYGKLELLGEGNFKYIADVYSWKKYIPCCLLKDLFIHVI